VEKLGYRVTGSEIVGLVPLSAMLDAGRFYLERQNAGMRGIGKMAVSPGLPERALVDLAIRSMGLRDVAKFNPDEKIIEYLVRDRDVDLTGMTCTGFADELSTDSPAPGGGSVAAYVGALAAALGAMVANLTVRSRDCIGSWDEMRSIAPRAQQIKEDLLRAVDDDTRAFNAMMEAMRSDGDVQAGIAGAAAVPMRVLSLCPEIAGLAVRLVETGLPASLSDAGVSAAAAITAARGACFNVLINVAQLEDRAGALKTAEAAEQLLKTTEDVAGRAVDAVTARLRDELSRQPGSGS
jgi:glutamate formiminotransferase/formiminotetrahydrofolate cyclodeaminase